MTKTKIALLVLSAVSSYCTMAKDVPARELEREGGNEQFVEFDPAFLNGGAAKRVDLSRFALGNNIEPGDYLVDIYINDSSVGKDTLSFKNSVDKKVVPCLKQDLLIKSGINVNALPVEIIERLGKGECVSLATLSSQITYQFDASEQRLNISVPQLLLQNKDKNYVRPELWDYGVTAGLLNYNANYYTTQTQGVKTDSAYVGINSGLNILGWSIRHNGSLNWQSEQGSEYQSINTYAQHDIVALKGRMTIGENSSSGQVFDSLPYRGIELQDDERMLPSSERGYAPEIRGIAKTNAKVTVRQNNLVIYETTVAPGAFAINDIFPSGYGSNLQVTVTEADGSTQTFEVPFAFVSQLLRPGAHHYDFIAGRYNDTGISHSPLFYQASYQYGLTNMLSAYGGVQYNENYIAVLLGSALNTTAGAISLDVTQANAKFNTDLPGEPSAASGQSYRISYSKYLSVTDSNLAIAAYRFSTKNYLDFRNAMQTLDALEHGGTASSIYRPKSRISITANQGLPGGWGQLFISGYAQDYWNGESKADVQYQVGYSTFWHTATLGLNASRTRNGTGDMETSLMFTVSMPLGSGHVTPQLNASFTRDGQGNTGEQVGLSGSLGKEHQYSYGLSATDYSNSSASYSLNGQYVSSAARFSANYGGSKDYSNASVGMTGAVIGYSDGIVMTPYVSDSYAIVEAQGATGARIDSYPGITVDRWGHAAVPYLNPYQVNEVALDPKGMTDEAELTATSQTVVPRAGAIVKVIYSVQKGYPVLINVSRSGGQVVPFGAEVFNAKGQSVGTVGQGGQVYARVEKEKDTLRVQWGDTKNAACDISYVLPAVDEKETAKTLIRFNAQCN